MTTLQIEIVLSPALEALLLRHAGAPLSSQALMMQQGATPMAHPEPSAAERRRYDWVTPDRHQRLTEMVQAGRQWRTIEPALAMLPGPSIPLRELRTYTRREGIRRTVSAARRAATLAAGQKGRAAIRAKHAAAAPATAAVPMAEAAPMIKRAPAPAAIPIPPAPAALQMVSRAIDARMQPTKDFGGEAVSADLEQVRAWAAQRGINVRTWDDLPAVNRKREALGQSRFKRAFPQPGKRRA